MDDHVGRLRVFVGLQIWRVAPLMHHPLIDNGAILLVEHLCKLVVILLRTEIHLKSAVRLTDAVIQRGEDLLRRGLDLRCLTDAKASAAFLAPSDQAQPLPLHIRKVLIVKLPVDVCDVLCKMRYCPDQIAGLPIHAGTEILRRARAMILFTHTMPPPYFVLFHTGQ